MSAGEGAQQGTDCEFLAGSRFVGPLERRDQEAVDAAVGWGRLSEDLEVLLELSRARRAAALYEATVDCPGLTIEVLSSRTGLSQSRVKALRGRHRDSLASPAGSARWPFADGAGFARIVRAYMEGKFDV